MSGDRIDLSQVPTFQLLQELADRCADFDRANDAYPKTTVSESPRFPNILDPAKAVPMQLPPSSVSIPQARPQFEGGEPWPPKNSKVQIIPGQFKKDGEPRRLISPGDPLVARLNPLNDSRSEADAQAGKGMRYIVTGDEREALAQSFIDQWQSEIAELERQRAGASEEELDRINTEVRRLQRQINLRARSAFGAMDIQEVKARNLQNSKGVVDAPSLRDPSSAQLPDTRTGLPEFDAPICFKFAPTCKWEVIPALIAALRTDPYRDPAGKNILTSEIPGMVTVQADPFLVWRIAAVSQSLFARDKDKMQNAMAFQTELFDRIFNAEHWSFEPPYMKTANPAADFKARVTHHLEDAYRSAFGRDEAIGIKRAIRIFNADFREKEIPDEWFEQTDGASPTGIHVRPHVDIHAPWKED